METEKYIPVWELQGKLRQALTMAEGLEPCFDANQTINHIRKAKFWLSELYKDMQKDNK